jgi:hypothetical protein
MEHIAQTPDPVLVVSDIHKSYGTGAKRKEVLKG